MRSLKQCLELRHRTPEDKAWPRDQEVPDHLEALQVQMSLKGFSNLEPLCLEDHHQAIQITEDLLQGKVDHHQDREVHHQDIQITELHLQGIHRTEDHPLETTCLGTQIHFKNDEYIF